MKTEDYQKRPMLTETRQRYAALYTRPHFTGGMSHQRAFVAPPGALRWTMADQANAVERGYFLERCYSDNHVRVLPIKRYAPDSLRPECRDDATVMAEIEHAVFRRDAFAAHALTFIVQQDRYGYCNVWDDNIARWTSQLKWYRELKARENATAKAQTAKMRQLALRRYHKE